MSQEESTMTDCELCGRLDHCEICQRCGAVGCTQCLNLVTVMGRGNERIIDRTLCQRCSLATIKKVAGVELPAVDKKSGT